jgi:hypothetical protein
LLRTNAVRRPSFAASPSEDPAMPTYKAPLDDVRFLLNEVLAVEELSQLPATRRPRPICS